MRLKQLLGVLITLLALGAVAVAAGSQLTNVTVASQGATDTVTLHATGAFTHNEYRPADDKILVDLTGVSAARLRQRERALNLAGVKSYRVLTYTGTSGAEVTRVELALASGAAVDVAQSGLNLLLKVSNAGSVAKAASQPVIPAVADVTPVQAAAQPAAQSLAPVLVRHIAVTRGAKGMEITISPKPAAEPQAMLLSNPDRLVIDLPNAMPAVRTREILVNSPEVKSVRVARYQENPPVTRVVIDLIKPQQYQLVADAGSLSVKMQPVTVAAPSDAPVPVQVVQQKPAEPAQQVQAAAQPAVAQPLVTAKADTQVAQPLVMVDASQPSSLPKVAPPDRAIEAAAVMANTIKNDAPVPPPAAAMPQAGQAVNLAQEQQNQRNSPTSSGPRYTGEPISVNLKDVDLKDFFRLIHEISGLNVVLDPSVKGSVTLVLDDVPWDQALDIVLRNNALDRQLEGNVLRIATIETLRNEAIARRQQLEAQALAVDRVTVTRFLSYARANDLVATLKRFISARGDLIADARTNALIIQDIPATIPSLDRLIAQLDRKTQEVEIEARVIAATRTFVREIGFQLGAGWGNSATAIGGNGDVGATGITAFNPPSIIQTGGPATSTGTATAKSIPLFSNYRVLNPTFGLSMINMGRNYRLDAYLSMQEQRGLLKILSRPRVVTQNNVQALVRQGFRLPVTTLSQLNGPPTVTYVDAFLRLTVTPQITVENTIFLTVDVENTTPDFTRTVFGNPVLLSQQTTTQVLVTDGGTVVIGGVVATQNNLTTEQAPFLGDIPILGNLFKHKTTNTQTQELIFFITPKIVQT